MYETGMLKYLFLFRKKRLVIAKKKCHRDPKSLRKILLENSMQYTTYCIITKE